MIGMAHLIDCTRVFECSFLAFNTYIGWFCTIFKKEREMKVKVRAVRVHCQSFILDWCMRRRLSLDFFFYIFRVLYSLLLFTTNSVCHFIVSSFGFLYHELKIFAHSACPYLYKVNCSLLEIGVYVTWHSMCFSFIHYVLYWYIRGCTSQDVIDARSRFSRSRFKMS